MNFFSFFRGQVLEEVNSPFNGKIQVVEYLGNRKIIVGGLIQSGGVLKNIWAKGLKKVSSLACRPAGFQHPVSSILILGLGGGTAAKLISQKWPKAKITGVEIDPAMIRLGKKYFNLDKIENLEIIEGDAIDFTARNQEPGTRKFFHTGNFDLILVDLYQGNFVVKETESSRFLKNLKKITALNGVIIFNRLFYDEHKETAEKFVKILEKHFQNFKLVRVLSNLFVVVQ